MLSTSIKSKFQELGGRFRFYYDLFHAYPNLAKVSKKRRNLDKIVEKEFALSGDEKKFIRESSRKTRTDIKSLYGYILSHAAGNRNIIDPVLEETFDFFYCVRIMDDFVDGHNTKIEPGKPLIKEAFGYVSSFLEGKPIETKSLDNMLGWHAVKSTYGALGKDLQRHYSNPEFNGYISRFISAWGEMAASERLDHKEYIQLTKEMMSNMGYAHGYLICESINLENAEARQKLIRLSGNYAVLIQFADNLEDGDVKQSHEIMQSIESAYAELQPFIDMPEVRLMMYVQKNLAKVDKIMKKLYY